MASNELVLVTGGSGFVGSHCILLLLQKGYRVRTTVRSLTRSDDVRSMLQAGGATEEQTKSVEFCEADLTRDEGWPEACKDCIFVLHVASPFPPAKPKHEDDLIVPAREGTLRAMRAAKAAGTVKRVVVTSSLAAISYGQAQREEPFTEKDWTNLSNPSASVPPYQKSKTIAERAAWDWMEGQGDDMELSVINPGMIFGPVLGKDFASSVTIVSRMLNGETPGNINMGFNPVDVRDVADLHLRAMVDPKAKGERFVAVTNDDLVWMKEVAQILKRRLGEKARKVPTRTVPNALVRVVGMFDGSVGLITSELSKTRHISNQKAKEVLGWEPRNAEEAVVAAAESLERFGLVKQ